MSAPEADNRSEEGDDVRERAASWVVRQDRRLSAAEQAELQAWLDADPRHATAFAQSTASWQNFRALGAGARRAAAPAPIRRSYWPVLGGLATAAALVVALVVFERHGPSSPPSAGTTATAAADSTRQLADGSTVRLKPGAEISEGFSRTERRVRLRKGEAFFTVAKDPARPFYVEVDNVTVRAIGTAFAVRFDPQAVDVLVTEGTVQVTPPPSGNVAVDRPDLPAPPALVGAGHRAVVARVTSTGAAATVVVSEVSAAEIARVIAGTSPLLDLAGATLGELVAAFAKKSGRRIEIADPALRAVRIGGLFPNEDVDGFVRVLEDIYDVKSERRADGSIVLRKAH